MPSAFIKDPDSVLDYVMDWSLWLAGDTIDTSTWSTPDAGITIDSDTNSTVSATVWLSGGVLGETHRLVNRITTTGLRTAERTITISISER